MDGEWQYHVTSNKGERREGGEYDTDFKVYWSGSSFALAHASSKTVRRYVLGCTLIWVRRKDESTTKTFDAMFNVYAYFFSIVPDDGRRKQDDEMGNDMYYQSSCSSRRRRSEELQVMPKTLAEPEEQRQ